MSERIMLPMSFSRKQMKKKQKVEKRERKKSAALDSRNVVTLIFSFGTIRDWCNWTGIDKTVWKPQIDALKPAQWRLQLPWLRGHEWDTRMKAMCWGYEMEAAENIPDVDGREHLGCAECDNYTTTVGIEVPEEFSADAVILHFAGSSICVACFAKNESERTDKLILDKQLPSVCTWRAKALD
jgi:hypothetical protein